MSWLKTVGLVGFSDWLQVITYYLNQLIIGLVETAF